MSYSWLAKVLRRDLIASIDLPEISISGHRPVSDQSEGYRPAEFSRSGDTSHTWKKSLQLI